MNDPISQSNANSEVLARLSRLEGYLGADPGNPELLAEAFETALQCKQWERAEFHLRHGQAVQPEALSWQLKLGDLLLAQELYPEASAALEALQHFSSANPEFSEVVLHNLAYIEFRQEKYAECIARLAPFMEDGVRPAKGTPDGIVVDVSLPEQLMRQLWLRSLHRTSELDRAFVWLREIEKAQPLNSDVAAIASLIAVDAGDMPSARRWVNLAMQQAQTHAKALPAEVYVAQLTLSLGDRKPDEVISWAEQALRLNAADGRAWSGRAFAYLLKSDFKQARRDFSLALKNMPGHIGTWHGQGWAELLDHELDTAEASFATALKLNRNFAESHGGMAVVLALKKQTVSARQYAERAMGLDKNNLSGRYALALMNGEIRDEVAIRKLAQRLLASQKNLSGVNVPEFIDGNPDA